MAATIVHTGHRRQPKPGGCPRVACVPCVPRTPQHAAPPLRGWWGGGAGGGLFSLLLLAFFFFSHPHRNRPSPAARACAPPFTVSGVFAFRFPPRRPTRALARPAACVRDGTSVSHHPLDVSVEGDADHTSSSAEQPTGVQLTRVGVWVACNTERAAEGLHHRPDRHPQDCIIHVSIGHPPRRCALCQPAGVAHRGADHARRHAAAHPPRPPPRAQPLVLRLLVARRACLTPLSSAGIRGTSPPRPAATTPCPSTPAPRGGAHPPSATHSPIPTNVPAA